MEPIDNVRRALDILRRQLAESLARPQAAASAGVAQGNKASQSTTRMPLRQSVAQRVRTLDPADPRFQQRAIDLFVESVLLDEFGESLRNDTAFRALTQEVARAMQADPQIAQDLSALVATLQRG